jgi:long-chain acyl-CoA synthetase
MIEPKRLFDCIEYQLSRKPLPDMMAAKESGQWKKYSTEQVLSLVNQLSAGLLSQGVGPNDMTVEARDKVAILSKNRPEWLMLDLAVQQIGAVLTPIYPTINVNELEFVLNDAQVKMVFVNDEDLFLKVLSMKDRVPSLKDIYTFEHTPNAKHLERIIESEYYRITGKVKSI